MTLKTKSSRIKDANYLILQVSMFGRRFFYNAEHNRVARFELSIDGKLWFRDEYTDKRIYIAYRGRWKNFTNGGTLRWLVEDLAKYIRTGERISHRHFGPWPEWKCEGDLWGYGKDTMAMLRNSMRPRDCVAWPELEEASHV